MNSMIAPARSACAIIPALAICLFPPLAATASQPAAPPAYLCDKYGAAEGLPENTVASVTRTADGYLWVATQEGLARFDGLRFEGFHMLDSPGLPHDNIHTVAAVRDGSLWVGTYNRGAAHFVRGRFQPVQGLVRSRFLFGWNIVWKLCLCHEAAAFAALSVRNPGSNAPASCTGGSSNE